MGPRGQFVRQQSWAAYVCFTDINQYSRDVRFVPIADACTAAIDAEFIGA
jgi:hypothetical protein